MAIKKMQQNTQSKLGTMKPMKIGANMSNKSQMDKEKKMKMSLPVKEMRYGEKPTKPYKIPKAGKTNGVGWGGEKSAPKKAVKSAGIPSKNKVMSSLRKTMGY